MHKFTSTSSLKIKIRAIASPSNLTRFRTSVSRVFFMKFTHTPSRCCPVRFARHCSSHNLHVVSLLSLPEASHWLLNPLLKIRPVEISTFLWWRAGEKHGKFQLYSESIQVVEREREREGGSLSLSLCLSVCLRERECE